MHRYASAIEQRGSRLGNGLNSTFRPESDRLTARWRSETVGISSTTLRALHFRPCRPPAHTHPSEGKNH
eukprot:164657-Pleurochrysis_carterae.AAC.2